MSASGRALSAVLTACLAAGCSSSELDGLEAPAGPDAGVLVPKALGCEVVITYPRAPKAVALDVLQYDEAGLLFRHDRTYDDGVVSTRDWQWSEDGSQATRTWFDGSRTIFFGPYRRVLGSITYDAAGVPEWAEEIDYVGTRIDKRRLIRKSDHVVTQWASYYYVGDTIRQVRTESLSEPTRSVVYSFDSKIGGLQMTQAHDVDTDGVIDFKTAYLFSEDGMIERGVDDAGQVIDYEYEGPLCGEIARSWALSDPFFLDM